MRARWRTLLLCTLVAMAGVVNLALRVGPMRWIHPVPLGLIATTGVALWGMITSAAQRWLVAVALLCLAPAGWAYLRSPRMLPAFLELLGLPGVLLVAGTLSATAVSIYMLLRPYPIPPDEGPPTARVV